MDEVSWSVADGIAAITINRPAKANALTSELLGEISRLYRRADADPAVRVVLLSGAGKGFSAGHDISGYQNHAADAGFSPERVNDDWRGLDSTATALADMWRGSVPIICAVHGYCLGIALELVVLSDLVVTEQGCRFDHPALRQVGGHPNSMMYPLVLGLRRTMQLFLLSDGIDGATAVQWGLANVAVGPGEARDAGRDWAKRVAALPPTNVRLLRRSVHRLFDRMGATESYELGRDFDTLAHYGPAAAGFDGDLLGARRVDDPDQSGP